MDDANKKKELRINFFIYLITTVYSFFIVYYINNIHPTDRITFLGVLPIIFVFIIKIFEICFEMFPKIINKLNEYEIILRYLFTIIIVFISLLQILIGEFIDYIRNGILAYDGRNILLSQFFPGITGSLATAFSLWLTIDITNQVKKENLIFKNSDLMSMSSLVAMGITIKLQIYWQGTDAVSIINYSLLNLNKFVNFIFIYISITIFIFASIRLLNIIVTSFRKNNDLKLYFSVKNFIQLSFLYLYLIVCLPTQMWMLQSYFGVIVCAIIGGIETYLYFSKKIIFDVKRIYLELTLIFQAVLFPLIVVLLKVLYPQRLINSSTDIYTLVLYMLTYLILIYFVIAFDKKILIINQIAKNAKISNNLMKAFYGTVCICALVVILTVLTFFQCFNPKSDIVLLAMKIYRGDNNAIDTDKKMIDVTGGVINKYKGKTILIWSAAANKYLTVKNNYSDINPLYAINGSIDDSDGFIIENGVDDGNIMLKSVINNKYLTSIGNNSDYINRSNPNYYINLQTFYNWPNPISAAYGRDDNIKSWQEFKIKKRGNYYYIVSNSNANSFGDSEGCYWTVFLDEKDLSGFEYNPIRSVMITAGSWEQFLIRDNLGNDINL